jgi:hypothetical protein
MFGGKNRPTSSPIHLLSNLLHNFLSVKNFAKIGPLGSFSKTCAKLTICAPSGDNSPNQFILFVRRS